MGWILFCYWIGGCRKCTWVSLLVIMADGLIRLFHVIFDIMLAFPSILLAIAIVSVLGPSLQNALIAIAIINVPNFGRLIRSKVLSIKEDEYITAAKGIGMKDARILFSHILPNSMAPVIVQGTLAIATAILEAAALGFLGLGAQAPMPEWGKMLADSKNYPSYSPMDNDFPRARNYAYRTGL